MQSLDRVAFVDHLSAGGVSRFLLALIQHMAALHPETAITYFVSKGNIERDRLDVAFAGFSNIALVPLDPPALNPTLDRSKGVVGAALAALSSAPALYMAARWTWRKFRSAALPASLDWWRYRLPAEVEQQLNDFDVVYFGWPFYCEPVDIDAPLVATFHDFHFKHFPKSYVPEQIELLDRETRGWLSRCSIAVTSTRFIRDELLRYYGQEAPDVDVVYLAPYTFRPPSDTAIENALARLGVARPYVLFSGGRSRHKNIAAVIEAVGILKSQGVQVHLAVTGLGTDAIGSSSDAPVGDPLHEMSAILDQYGLVRAEDYFPLGYVDNADVDALIAGANVVVSASLYEAGCGPANDAWQAGVPVAFSRIAPFMEQIEHFGVEAWVFDPHDPVDIAEKLRSALLDTGAAQAMAERSSSAFASYTWDDVAREYYRVFERAAELGPRT